MDAGMGRDAELHNDRETLHVAIIAGVSLSLSPFYLPILPSFSPVPLSQSNDKDPLIDANERTTELPPQNRRLQHHGRAPPAASRNLKHTHVMLLGPESGGARVRWCQAVGTFGVPLRVCPGLKIR
jgi:hypothetical protein